MSQKIGCGVFVDRLLLSILTAYALHPPAYTGQIRQAWLRIIQSWTSPEFTPFATNSHLSVGHYLSILSKEEELNLLIILLASKPDDKPKSVGRQTRERRAFSTFLHEGIIISLLSLSFLSQLLHVTMQFSIYHQPAVLEYHTSSVYVNISNLTGRIIAENYIYRIGVERYA